MCAPVKVRSCKHDIMAASCFYFIIYTVLFALISSNRHHFPLLFINFFGYCRDLFSTDYLQVLETGKRLNIHLFLSLVWVKMRSFKSCAAGLHPQVYFKLDTAVKKMKVKVVFSLQVLVTLHEQYVNVANRQSMTDFYFI